jgi:3-phenylpropionate/trans-cinnamate dioxygenase ferredoxin reductase component
MPENHGHVIVGGGLAGAKAAEALREEGYEGRVVLLAAEDEQPYERPPLSKDYLRGESERESARVHPSGFYEEHDIELRTGATAERIDTAGRAVTLADGERLRYDRLLLATGSEPRRLRVLGAELPGVLYLRDLADADVLASRLNAGDRMVVIGAGWIGAEVAASARQNGLEVAMVEMANTPLERVLGPEVGEIYAELHRDHGVDLRTGVSLESFEGGSRGVERVRLADGSALDCDLVVVGVGATPRTALAEQAGIAADNGILVNDRLETSEPGVFAAGDVANAIHPFYRRLIRVEHWANALNQPATAARAMLGKDASYELLPYFFSDQYDVGMEYSGYAGEWDEVVLRGDPAKRELIAFWLRAGRVVAGMNMNVWDVTEPIKALIHSRQVVPVERLRDPGVPLEELVAPAGVAGAVR